MERQIDLKEHQKIMLNILTDFANFCENHNLKYFIDSGTLLGAVRHQGFIPWDNDIDVNMPREDYDKFIQIIGPKKKINNHISVELPTDTMYTYCRIVDIRTTLIEFEKSYPFYSHIYIDLFPKDKLLCDGIRTRAFCRKNYRIGLWHWMHKYTSKKWLCSKNPIKKAVGYIDCLFVKNRNKSFFKQDKMIRKYERKIIKKNPQYITTLVLGEYDRKIEKEVFAQSIELMFEGRLFKAPIGYDKYLKCFYGDYMKLPPKEKQRIHHVSCWWNEVTHD